MNDSYNDQIETLIVTRERLAARRKEERQKQCMKQIGVIAAGVLALIIVIAIICKGCSSDKKSNNEKPVVTTTQVQETTTIAEESTTDSTASLNGSTMYTTDILNLRKKASKDAKLVCQIPKGKAITVNSNDGKWCNISYGDNKGFVKLEFLSTSKPK